MEMRIAHYLNQFFGGVGAEEHAGRSLEIRDGAVGPGKLFESFLGADASVALTFVCGDNYAVEHQAELTAAILEKLRAAQVDLFVAGPCFDAGRYGMAAGALCRAVQAELGIPAVAAMSEENPGVDLYRDALYIIDSGTNITKLRDVVGRMARLSKKLIAHEPIGLPLEEGYLRRGWLRDRLVEKRAGTRLVDMLMDMSKAKVMLITDGGLVPRGNPDRIEGTAATRWGSYNIQGRDDLRAEDYEVSHGGYDTRFVQEDPDRLVPLDALREMEKNGVIGKLHDEFLSTCGRSNPLSNTRRLGREMAEKIKKDGVDAVILTST
jgi:glycine reductase complex component B subunit gamma